jgi:hypothetical protein
MTIGGMLGLAPCRFGDRDLEIGQDFEQERLERLVVRSSSSISSTGGPAVSGSSAFSSGRLTRSARRRRRFPAARDPPPSASASRIAIICAGIVPLIDRRGDVEPLVALQPDQLAPERRRQRPWRSRSCRRPPRLRETAAGPCAAPGTGRSRASGRRHSRPEASSVDRLVDGAWNAGTIARTAGMVSFIGRPGAARRS